MPEMVDVLAIIFAICMVAPVFWFIKRDNRPRQDVGGGDIGSGDGWADHGHHGGHGDASGHDGGGDGGDGGNGH